MPVDILDYTQDEAGREAHRLTALFPAPDFVKNASALQLCGDADQLPLHIYADPQNKLYRCHSGPATWMSSLYFYNKQASIKPERRDLIEKRILKAADYFGIRRDVDELRTKIAANVAEDLQKLADDQFAVVWQYADGGMERHWPLRNAREVDFAAHHFVQHRDKFAVADRFRVAQRILEKAAAYGVPLDSEGVVWTYSGDGHCAAADIVEMCESRANLLQRSHADGSEMLRKFAADVRNNPQQARSRDFRFKLADAIEQIDRGTKLDRLYGDGGLPRPEEVLFAVTEKVATSFVDSHVHMTNGNVYALADLEKLAIDQVRDWMGDEFAEAVGAGDLFVDGTKIAAIVPTLDRGAAGVFERLLQEAAVRPVLLDKAAAAGLSRTRMFELAAQYVPAR